MKHLQLAKLFLEDEDHGVNTKEEYELAGVTHALIAIAEGQVNLNKTLDLLLVDLCKKTGKIAEQLEKMNDNITDIGIANGWWSLEDREDCPDCNGEGKHLSENETYKYDCLSCSGTGKEDK